MIRITLSQLVKYVCIAVMLVSSLLSSREASADLLPWLSHAAIDPFSMQKKASEQVAPSLRPDSCQVRDAKHTLTLSDVVISALCNNPDTQAAYLNLVAQAATYVSNYSGYLPTGTGSFARNRITNYGPKTKSTADDSTYGLSLGMTLYDFGQREFKLETAELAFLAAGHTYNSTLQGTIANALQGYYSLLNAQNALAVAKESEQFARESFDAAALRHRIGQVALADELQANNNYSQAQLATESAKNALALQQASLAQLMGLSPDTPVIVAEIDDRTLAKDPFRGRVQDLMESAKDKRHDLQAGRESLKSSEASFQALKRSDLATISATTNLGMTNNKPNIMNYSSARTQGIGVSVSIPIFTGFNQTYNERAAEYSLDALRKSLITTERNVESDVWTSWLTYQTAKTSWKTSHDQIASALQLKRVALGQYKEGQNSILDVLNAQLQFSTALQSRLSTRYSLLTSRVNLVRAVGVLDLESMNPESTLDSPADDTPQHMVRSYGK
jgi:outer membrane protein